MPPGATNLRHVILGLLGRRPMSGYDIKRNLKGLDWLIGSPSSGSLYPVLRTLLQDGCATVEVHPHESRPPRKIYSITEVGRQELSEWIEQPFGANAPLKAFLMRLVLADEHPPEVLVAHLCERRSQVASRQAAYEQIISAENSTLPELGLAWDYGLALAMAEITWLDRALDQFASRAQQRSSVEVIDSGGVTTTE